MAYQPEILKLLRTPICQLVSDGAYAPKIVACVDESSPLGDHLPKIDILQFSQTNPDGVTTLIVTKEDYATKGITCTEDVAVLDSREVVTVFYHHIKRSGGASTPVLMTTFLQLPLHEVVKQSPKVEPVRIIESTAMLADILEAFRSTSRILVTEKSNNGAQIKYVFTVTDLLKLLDDRNLLKPSDTSQLPTELSAPLRSYAITLRKPLSLLTEDRSTLTCCMKDDPIMTTLHKIVITHHRGLPVLGDVTRTTNRMGSGVMAIVSTSDFVVYILHWQNFLQQGVDIQAAGTLPFVSLVKQMVCLQAVNPCISMTLDSSLSETFSKMKACKIHRLMITNGGGDVCGVISVSDIGKFVAAEMAGIFDEALI